MEKKYQYTANKISTRRNGSFKICRTRLPTTCRKRCD
nr:hypothetical protein [Staphylococcus aureus]